MHKIAVDNKSVGDSKRIAVYGSLKKGKHNHDLLKDQEFVGNTVVRGTLYRVSSYPALTDEGDNQYDAEIYNVSDEVYGYIRSMELGAGYKEVEVDGCIVYYADDWLKQRCRESYELIDLY